MDLTQLLGWLNDTLVKSILLILGGFILKRWAPFVNKAIPMTLSIFSGVTAFLAALFPEQVPGIVPGSYVFTSVAGVELYSAATAPAKAASWLWNTLAPVAFAIASHSGPKNTVEWLKLGVGLLWPGGQPPAKAR